MKLQLALDFIELAPALEIAEKTADYVDILEAGTPLIKAVGLESVRTLKDRFAHKIIDADMKAADVGDLETKIAAQAGANIVHVLGITPLQTIKEAVLEAKNYPDTKITVDIGGIKELVGMEGLKQRIKQIEDIAPDYLEVHTTISQQREGMAPFSDIREISKLTDLPLAVAGGITAQNANELKDIGNLEIVIVGGGITKAQDALAEAKKIKKIISQL
ncbi:MAG: 3-hexulose-6-phosphate synthase [Candidatus Moranbacteria bacterium]|nr:3-hexulose-6-phosphate synthase [Candidatus Moranbacteria bacterium]